MKDENCLGPVGIGHNFNGVADCDEGDHEFMWDMMLRFTKIDANNLAFEAKRAKQKRIDEMRPFIPEEYMAKHGLT